MISNDLEMILIDLDGTLLNSEGIVPKENKEVIRKLISKGYKIAVATGRNHQEAKALTADISDLAYITTNGSHVEDFAGEVIYNRPLSQELVVSILNILEEYPSLVRAICFSEKILINDLDKFVKIILSSSDEYELDNLSEEEKSFEREKITEYIKEVDKIKNHVNNAQLQIQKILTLSEKDNKLTLLKKELEEQFGSKIKISNSGGHNLEINANDVSKGEALKILADRLNVSLKNTIAFGDSNNDIELLKTAGVAVAMENSKCELLRKEADFITASNDNHGVAKVLSELLV